MKITLSTISSGFLSNTTMSLNFSAIQNEFQNKVLYRNNPTGEPNQMLTDLDMNSKRIINLPEPLSVNEPARLKDIQNSVSGLLSANLIPFTPHTSISATTVQGAINEVVDDLLTSTGSTLVGFAQTALAGSSGILRNIYSKLLEAAVTPEDYNAIGDGITDDTIPVTKAIKEAIATKRVCLINKRYLITSNIVISGGSLVLVGHSSELSELLFSNSSALLYTSTTTAEWDADQVEVKSIGFRVIGTSTVSPLSFTFTGGTGGTNRSFVMEDCEITSNDINGKFLYGAELTNARNVRLSNIRVLGDRDAAPITTKYAFLIKGLDSPTDIYIDKCSVYFCAGLVEVQGEAEGLFIEQSVAIACYYLVNWNTVGTNPLLTVRGCHINTSKAGIVSATLAQVLISDNIFYATDVDGTSTDYAGINLIQGTGGTNDDNIIHNNVFIGYITGVPKNAIIIGGAGVNQSLIAGNIINSFDSGIWLIATSDKVVVADTNIFNSCTTNIINSGTNNIIAYYSGTSTGYKQTLDGLIDQWGTSAILLDASGNGSITLPKTFPTSLYTAVTTNGDPAAASNASFCINYATSTTSTLNVSVRPNPGAITVRVNWMAKGA